MQDSTVHHDAQAAQKGKRRRREGGADFCCCLTCWSAAVQSIVHPVSGAAPACKVLGTGCLPQKKKIADGVDLMTRCALVLVHTAQTGLQH